MIRRPDAVASKPPPPVFRKFCDVRGYDFIPTVLDREVVDHWAT